MGKVITFDLSKAGWKAAVGEFFLSLVKTAVAAVIVFVGVKLNGLHINDFVRPEYAGLATLGVGLVRASMTSVYVWATTTKTEPLIITQPTQGEIVV